MSIGSVLIADSSQTSGNLIKDILVKRGYRVYQASDGSGAMRIARTIRPNLVIMDANLWGTDIFETGRLIEREKLSSVIYITAKPDKGFTEELKSMKVFAYITRPIIPAQLIQIVEFSIANSDRIAALEKRVEKLEDSLTARKTVERAKGIMMERLGISEKEAYHRIRKESMDRSIPMEKAAGDIIVKYGG